MTTALRLAKTEAPPPTWADVPAVERAQVLAILGYGILVATSTGDPLRAHAIALAIGVLRNAAGDIR